MSLKIGRAECVTRRIRQWEDQCGSVTPLKGWWPQTDAVRVTPSVVVDSDEEGVDRSEDESEEYDEDQNYDSDSDESTDHGDEDYEYDSPGEESTENDSTDDDYEDDNQDKTQTYLGMPSSCHGRFKAGPLAKRSHLLVGEYWLCW